MLYRTTFRPIQLKQWLKVGRSLRDVDDQVSVCVCVLGFCWVLASKHVMPAVRFAWGWAAWGWAVYWIKVGRSRPGGY